MTRSISIFSDVEIIDAALTAAKATNVFKLRDVRRILMSDTGHKSTDFWKEDQRISRITGAKVSAILRAHPDLFTVRFRENGRVHSFSKAGAA